MKNKTFNLSSRCIAFFLSLLMIMSCFTAVTFSSSAAEPETPASQTGTSFKDGIYTITVNADSLFEMYDNKSLSAENLKEVIPSELLDAVTTNGSAYDKLLSILRTYFTLAAGENGENLYDIFPVDMTVDHLVDGNDPILWNMITKEDLVANIDFELVFGKLDASDFERIVNSTEVVKIAIDSGLLTDEMAETLIDDLKTNNKTEYDKLIADGTLSEDVTNAQDAFERIGAEKALELWGFEKISETVGMNNLATNDAIIDCVDITELLHIISEKELLLDCINAKNIAKVLDKGKLIEEISKYIIKFSESISVNGVEVYTIYTSKIDVNLLTQVVTEAMPTFDKLANDPENAFSFVVDWKLNEDQIDPASTNASYAFGLNVKLVGDTERVASISDKLSEYISIRNIGDSTSISLNIPPKVASMFLKAVNSDKLPDELKSKLLSYMDMELTEENINSIIADFTVEEIATIIENTDFTLALDVVDAANGLYPGAYDRAVAMAERAVGAMTFDRLAVVAGILGIENIENKLDSKEEQYNKLLDKVLDRIDMFTEDELREALENGTFGDYNTLLAEDVRSNASALNAIRDYMSSTVTKVFDYVPEGLTDVKLSDFYTSQGQFAIDKEIKYDIGPKLEELLSSKLSPEIADYAMDFLTNTEINRKFTVDVSVGNMYLATFKDESGKVLFTTYLPAGADINSVLDAPELGGVTEWTYDGKTVATKMPDRDTVFVKFDPNHVCNMVFVKTVAPTCTQYGYDLYVCNCFVEEYRNIVPALGHDVSEHWTIIKYPTKTTTGIAHKSCEREGCDYVADDFLLPMLPDATNDFYTVTINLNDNCTNREIVYDFKIDTDEFSYTVKAPVEHIWSEWTITNPNIFDEGEKVRHCTVCNAEDIETISKLDQDQYNLKFDIDGKTITVTGMFAVGMEHKLDVKDLSAEFSKDQWLEENGAVGIANIDMLHVYDITLDTPTGFYDHEKGLRVSIPIESQYAEKEIVIFHKKADDTIEKFSVEDGNLDINTDGEYPVAVFKVTSFSPFLVGKTHEHTYAADSWTVVEYPTLTKTGLIQRVCTGDATHIETYELPVLNTTDYQYSVIKAPDCENKGTGAYVFTTEDGQKLTFNVDLEASGHAWGEWTVSKIPTTEAEGELERVCPNGNTHKETHILPKLNDNDYQRTVITAASCMTTGEAKYTYTHDGKTFEFKATIPAIGHHDWDEWKVNVAPTLTSGGSLKKECKTDATHTEIHDLPALNKTDYTYKVVKEPTATEDGSATYTYTHDGQTFVFEVDLPATGEPDKDNGFPWWIILLIILVIIIVVLIIFLINRNNDNNPPAEEPEEEPTPIVEPEPEPEVEEIPEPVVEPEPEPEPVVPIVEGPVDADKADEILPDEVAMETVVTVAGGHLGRKAIINIGDINDAFSEGETVTLAALKAKKLVPASAQRYKVLAFGFIDKALTIEAEEFSIQAVKMIQLTGGKVIKLHIEE